MPHNADRDLHHCQHDIHHHADGDGVDGGLIVVHANALSGGGASSLAEEEESMDSQLSRRSFFNSCRSESGRWT